MSSPLPISLLDLALVDAGSTASHALHNAVETAQAVEGLGYRRVWYAEHHSTPSIASSCPDLLISRASAATTRIRVGSGGVMLPNHAPLAVAERFKTLAAFAPGRIDLGIGRAPGTTQIAALALRRSAEALAAEDFPEQLAELLAYEDHAFPAGHPFASISVTPNDAPLPPIWLLGSSGFSSALAARVGLGFAFAAHINLDAAVPAMLAYRQQFMPSARFPEPHAILAVSVVCGEDDEHARYLASSLDVSFVRLRTGNPQPVASPEEARAHQFTPAEQAILADAHRRVIVGGPETVRSGIERLAEATRADEVMVLTMVYGHEQRLASLERVARVFALEPAPVGS
jgi:luciferase family oxidoreductase group 1